MKAIVEIPQGSLHKYEVEDPDSPILRLKLDRLLNQPCPHNYGYIPRTLSEDGDPIDVFILHDSPIHPLTEVEIELVGMIACIDKGVSDHKLLAIVKGSRYSESPSGVMGYLRTYKDDMVVLGHSDWAAAVHEVNLAAIKFNLVKQEMLDEFGRLI
jgi:hypothetical protein